jgi:hypothetical protein
MKVSGSAKSRPSIERRAWSAAWIPGSSPVKVPKRVLGLPTSECLPSWDLTKERTKKLLLCLLFLAAVPAPVPALAQSPWQAQDPDWPCAQRLVPILSAGTYWNGPIPAQTGWRDDDALFPLAITIVDRDTQDSDAIAKLIAYVASLPLETRAAKLPTLFSAIVDQTNDIRAVLIQRLKKIGRRQIGMGQTIAALSNRLDALKQDDPKRDDITGERDLDVRAFQETQHIVRYACEAPANMERRLGIVARLLQRK